MDTSEQYIKMCKRAEEIQKLWKPEGGDFYAPPARDRVCFYFGLMDSDFLWLPRQDQLQKMVLSDYGINNPGWAMEALISCLGDEINKFSSHEQIWLGFVMHERHRKIWNGEEWING